MTDASPAAAATEPREPRGRTPTRATPRGWFGLHFDFHATEAYPDIGGRLDPRTLVDFLRRAAPDFVQVDVKGHPGWSSYPTRVGLAAPGLVGDPLRRWRDATRELGIGLYAHFCGLQTAEQARRHPRWARVDASGEADAEQVSMFSGFDRVEMLPQLIELATAYELEGAWLDGETAFVKHDYGDAALAAFSEVVGRAVDRAEASSSLSEAYTAFLRDRYRERVRRLAAAVHDAAATFRVCFSWAFSGFMPEPVSAEVDFLSGDVDARDTVDTLRLNARLMARQGLPWDLMTWGWVTGPESRFRGAGFKPAGQLCREAACVMSLGGAFQVYLPQEKDATPPHWAAQALGTVSSFCRERRAWCLDTAAVPQVGLIYSGEAHYAMSRRLFQPYDGVTRGALGLLRMTLDAGWAAECPMPHQLDRSGDDFPLLVWPQWPTIDPQTKGRLRRYVDHGGTLLVVGARAAGHFADWLGVDGGKEPQTVETFVRHGDGLAAAWGPRVRVVPGPGVETLAWAGDRPNGPHTEPLATVTRVGRGAVAAVYVDLAEAYLTLRSSVWRDVWDAILRRLMPEPLARLDPPHGIDLVLGQRDGELLVHLINTQGPHGDRTVAAWDHIPDAGGRTLTIRRPRAVSAITRWPAGDPLDFTTTRDGATVAAFIPRSVHDILHVS